jgi:uncharacterized protein YcbX
MEQLTLSEIWIYPIKSLGGISLPSAKVLEKGLLHDRRWMLIDEHNTFMTQRVNPKMALFHPSINHGRIHITKRLLDNNPSIDFNIDTPPNTDEPITAKIWDDEVIVFEVDERINHWFTQHLSMPCRLVTFPEHNLRPVDPRYKVYNEHVSLADAYPFLLIGQRSLDDLNTRLEHPLPMNRFRPNFVFTGGIPFEEDTWRNFTIGGNRFMAVKPCARCVLTTINQHTAERGAEPLLTLSKYRKQDNKVLFGQNLLALDHIEVSVGDKITLN